MTAPNDVIKLIDKFNMHRDSYKSRSYIEYQARSEFIDPFFRMLGWDIYNEQNWAEAYKEVIREDAVTVGGATKAPDYCFRVGGVRKFFVEAKKPSVDIKHDIHPAYQLRRYAWSGKLPLSILTDFEEFAVYDCRIRPVKMDTAAKARVGYFKYTEYDQRWDEIASVFSKEAILKGSFDKYVESTKRKRGTAEVDKEFLKEIENWREILARNIALRNPSLTRRELNYAVQRTIDRIIFLRICEDRGIEGYGQLQELLEGNSVYSRLCKLFLRADDRYNSGLFHFKRERDRTEAPDEFTLELNIDDRTLKDIIKNIYYPDSPYEFSVLPADILGQVYEQFLGKVIRLTPAHRAVVEDKPEVKKAGGVYYTPTYIVEYIVENTVGELLEGNSPRGASKLKILDPACGSGSFLIGAYQYLLDWHLQWYSENDPGKRATGRSPRIYEGPGGDWRLTTGERKRILLNNIYGVDIDPQAVEVTKLSLVLKVLEGENEQTLAKQLQLFQERALPDLSNNIKCGNSLIGPDIYDGQQMPLFDEEERYRINVFDWDVEFPDIMNRGGFDAVIGNPPYIRIQKMKEWAPTEVEFYKETYPTANKGSYDIYIVFVERGLALLNSHGIFGFILPNKFFNAKYGRSARRLLSSGKHLFQIVHFGAEQVFKNSTTYTCLLFLTKKGVTEFPFIKVNNLTKWRNLGIASTGNISAEVVTENEWNFVVGEGAPLFIKLSKNHIKLGDVADIFVGLQTSADNVYIMDLVKETTETICLKSKALDVEWTFEKGILFPVVSGVDVKRYSPLPKRQFILFPYKVTNEHPELMDFDEISNLYPNTAKYLLQNKKRLEDRERGKFRDDDWYRFGRNQNIGIQERIKLCVPRLVDRLYSAYDDNGTYYLDNVDVGGIVLKREYQERNLLYLLVLLNSKLLRWYFPFISASFRGGWFSANRQFLSKLPIRLLDLQDSKDKEHNEVILELVSQMLDLHKLQDQAKTPGAKTTIKRQIDATDRQIDRLVYELYDLTEEEISIVEENT